MTLIEVIVAISLLGIVLVGVLTLMTVSMKATIGAGKDIKSVETAAGILENALSGKIEIVSTGTEVQLQIGGTTVQTIEGYIYSSEYSNVTISYSGTKTASQSVSGKIVLVVPSDSTDQSKVEVFIPDE